MRIVMKYLISLVLCTFLTAECGNAQGRPAQASADDEDFIYTEYTIERNGIALHLDCLKEENTDPEKHIFDSPD